MTKKEEAINNVFALTPSDFTREDFVNIYKYARRWFIEDKDYSSPMGKIYKAADRCTFYDATEYLRNNNIGIFVTYPHYSCKQANKLTNLKQLCTFIKHFINDDDFNAAITLWLNSIKRQLEWKLTH